MLFALAVFALALSGAPAPQAVSQANEVAPAIVEPRRGWGGVVPSDAEIGRQLDKLVVEQPDRVVCINMSRTGSRLPHPDCRTLRDWYDFETDRDIQALIARVRGDNSPVGGMFTAPYELIDTVKAKYRLPSVRAKAEARARDRIQAKRPTSQALPPVSNP
jgi:hypothetical protein